MDYEKGYVFDLMEQGGPTDVREPYFKDAVDHVLKFGLMGLSISTSGGEAYMSRALLVDKYELIEAHCDDERLRTSHESIFKL